jgi:hypothetical protein
MLRGTALAFVAGWLLWFWLDKNPATLGPLPPPANDDYIRNFQIAIDLVKQARLKAAYVYIWKAHYIVLSLAIGLAIGALLGALSRSRFRKKFRKFYLPERKEKEKTSSQE